MKYLLFRLNGLQMSQLMPLLQRNVARNFDHIRIPPQFFSDDVSDYLVLPLPYLFHYRSVVANSHYLVSIYVVFNKGYDPSVALVLSGDLLHTGLGSSL